MRRIRLLAIGLFVILVPSAPAIAEGEHGEHGGHGEHGSMHDEMEAKLMDTSAFGQKGDAAAVSRTIAIEATEIKFDATALKIRAGETVRFIVTNGGEQAHEFTLGDTAYQEVARQMMVMMGDMGMDMTSPEHAATHGAGGNYLLLQPGESGEIIWQFTVAGTFQFSCNFPGHAEVGMVGEIVVQ